MLTGDTREANNYREYNPEMALPSIGVEIKLPPGNGPYCFRIHGKI
jgi:hypothetical protein